MANFENKHYVLSDSEAAQAQFESDERNRLNIMRQCIESGWQPLETLDLHSDCEDHPCADCSSDAIEAAMLHAESEAETAYLAR